MSEVGVRPGEGFGRDIVILCDRFLLDVDSERTVVLGEKTFDPSHVTGHTQHIGRWVGRAVGLVFVDVDNGLWGDDRWSGRRVKTSEGERHCDTNG